jgi:hypothetical protein
VANADVAIDLLTDICGCKDRIELLAGVLGIPKPVYRLNGGGLRPFFVAHSRSDLAPRYSVSHQLPLEIFKRPAMAEFPPSNSDRRWKIKLGVVIPAPHGHSGNAKLATDLRVWDEFASYFVGNKVFFVGKEVIDRLFLPAHFWLLVQTGANYL